MTEANMFSNLNKDKFVYDNGKVIIKYRYLILAQGPLTAVDFTGFNHNDIIFFNGSQILGQIFIDNLWLLFVAFI